MPDVSRYVTDNNKTGLRKGILGVHLLIFIVIIIIVFSIVFLADLYYVSPRYETDYFSQYNEITKPSDYNPSDNAWPNLLQAFRWLPEPPDSIKPFIYFWPKDMNDSEIAMVRNWVDGSTRNIYFLNRASAQKYAWHLYRRTSGYLADAIGVESRNYRISNQLMVTKAILLASQGDPDSAFEMLKDIYKISFFLSDKNTVMEQLLGIHMRAAILDAAIEITAYSDPGENAIENFQKSISLINTQYPVSISYEAERIVFLDAAQQDFIDRKNGVAETATRMISKYGLKAIKVSRQSTLETSEKTFAYLNTISDKMPYELDSAEAEKQLKKITQKNVFVNTWASYYLSLIELSYRSRMYSDALISILALQRYKIKTGDYPDSLFVLQQAGYIDNIPIDVYSGKPLVYRKTQDGCILYSYAVDRDDDGGRHNSRWAGFGDGDYVFWPIQEIVSGGIIYR